MPGVYDQLRRRKAEVSDTICTDVRTWVLPRDFQIAREPNHLAVNFPTSHIFASPKVPRCLYSKLICPWFRIPFTVTVSNFVITHATFLLIFKLSLPQASHLSLGIFFSKTMKKIRSGPSLL